jgi:hypothetical protein
MAENDALEGDIREAAAALGLEIAPEWLPAVAVHVRILRQHGAAVMTFPLDDDVEPAPVFVP